jgi:hypothetical protein
MNCPSAVRCPAIGCAGEVEASGNRPPGEMALSRPCANLCSSSLISSLNPGCIRTTKPEASVPSVLQAKDGFPTGTTLGSKPQTQLPELCGVNISHFHVTLRATQLPTDCSVSDFLLAHWTSFFHVFETITLRGAGRTSTEVKQRFSTSGFHFPKNVVASSLQSTTKSLHWGTLVKHKEGVNVCSPLGMGKAGCARWLNSTFLESLCREPQSLALWIELKELNNAYPYLKKFWVKLW